MNRTGFKLVLGVATLLLSLILNFRHALNDYGILENKLHVEVLAQSNGSGGGGGSTLPEVTVTCPASDEIYGNCRYIDVITGLYGVCWYKCLKTEDTSSTCTSFWVNLANFCSALGGTT